MKKYFLLIFLLSILPLKSTLAETLIIDAVVATVDGEPITLSEVTELMPEPRPDTLEAAKGDAVFKSTLETLINEKLLELEAASKRISVSENEVSTYVNSIAERNGLSLEEFANALQQEGKTLDMFQRSIKTEILKNKIANSLIQDGVAVSQQDVNSYLEQIGESDTSGQKQVKLKQILISSENKSSDAVKAKCQNLHEELEAGADFSELAALHSDSPEGKDGGALEPLAESELNPAIFDAILTLNDGEFSAPVESAIGCQIFLVAERYDSVATKPKKKGLRSEAKKQLERQKLEERFQTYFSSEVYKNHTIERKV